MDFVKYLRRRHPSRIECVLIAFAAWPCAAPSQPRTDAATASTLDALLRDVRTLTADFRQEIWTADQRLLETSTGTLALARPNRFVWRSEAPVELTVIADGERLWTYDVELEQATVAPLADSAGASPALLLSGDAGVREQFDVVRRFPLDGLDWFELTPAAGGADFSTVRIAFDGGAPQRLELVDGLNQTTRVELANVVVNADLAGDTFRFEPPRGVDVIGGG